MPPLPGLQGRWLAGYRLLWAALLLAAAAALVVGQLHDPQPARLIHAFVLVAVAAILFRRRPADPVAAMLSLAFLLWAITTSSASAAMDRGETVLALVDRARFLLFVTAMLLFPGGQWRPRWTVAAAAASGAVFVMGVFAAVGLAPVALYQPLAMACAALAVAALRQRFTELPPGIQRQQIKWVLLGLGAGLALVAASRLGALLVVPLSSFARDLLFDAGVIVMALGMLVSLLRFRLYDVDAAISRSTTYAALTVAVVAAFAASEAVIQVLSQSWFGGNAGALSGGIAAALAAALIAPLHRHVTDWAERRFRKELAALERELPPLLADLREMTGLEVLAETVLDHVELGVRATRASLVLGGVTLAARQPREAGGLDAIFSLRVPLTIDGRGTVGWLLVGSRPDGSQLPKDEREALMKIAGPVARALWIVRLRERKEAANARLAARSAAEIRSLRDRLSWFECAP